MASQYINYSKEAHEKAQAELAEQKRGYTVTKWHNKCREFERKNGDADATFHGRDCYWKAMRKIEKMHKGKGSLDKYGF